MICSLMNELVLVENVRCFVTIGSCVCFKKGNNESMFRLVKRTHKCKNEGYIEKQIYIKYYPNVKAIVQSGSVVNTVEQYAAVSYWFKEN